MRADETTPDTRLSDDPMKFNPASVSSLIHLMLGGLHPGHQGSILHCRLRYFDPLTRRARIPEDVGALVERLTGDEVTLTLVNTNQIEPRTFIVQGDGYAEHQFINIRTNKHATDINAPYFSIQLEPGCGAMLQIHMRRYANQPTMTFPWDQGSFRHTSLSDYIDSD